MLILGLSSRLDTTEVRQYRPFIAYNAAALSMSEKVGVKWRMMAGAGDRRRVRSCLLSGGRRKCCTSNRTRPQVEATVSKAALWIGGTVAGAILGYVCMVSSDLATNPYGLMTIICAFTFLVGALATHQVSAGSCGASFARPAAPWTITGGARPHCACASVQYKVLITLTLMCFGDMVLNQYWSFPPGCTTCTGTEQVCGLVLERAVLESHGALEHAPHGHH